MLEVTLHVQSQLPITGQRSLTRFLADRRPYGSNPKVTLHG